MRELLQKRWIQCKLSQKGSRCKGEYASEILDGFNGTIQVDVYGGYSLRHAKTHGWRSIEAGLLLGAWSQKNDQGPAMNRRNVLFAGHDEGGRNWARFASLIGICKMNGIEPYAYLRGLFISLVNGHLAQDINTLMPWACAQQISPSQSPRPGLPRELMPNSPATERFGATEKSMGRNRRIRSGIITSIGYVHDKGHDEIWFIAMDALPIHTMVFEYRLRWGIEAMFFDSVLSAASLRSC